MTLSSGTPAGWYEDAGSLRYWDGDKWTDQRAPKPLAPMTQRALASAVLIGVLAAWFVVWLLAQMAPETFYLPVKFVVKELPSLYGH
jgi:hypothetical protein